MGASSRRFLWQGWKPCPCTFWRAVPPLGSISRRNYAATDGEASFASTGRRQAAAVPGDADGRLSGFLAGGGHRRQSPVWVGVLPHFPSFAKPCDHPPQNCYRCSPPMHDCDSGRSCLDQVRERAGGTRALPTPLPNFPVANVGRAFRASEPLNRSGFEFEAGGGEGVQAAPEEAVDGDDHGGHDDGGGEEDAEIAGVGGGADDGAEADG